MKLSQFHHTTLHHGPRSPRYRMYWPTALERAIRASLVLLACTLISVDATNSRKDLCGLSMHASDFPDVGTFSSIEATWTIPEIPLRWDQPAEQARDLSHGVALCCGDDCSTRIAAGFVAQVRQQNRTYTALPMLLVGPLFEPYYKGFDFYDIGTWFLLDGDTVWLPVLTADDSIDLTSSDRVWVRLELRSATSAHV